MKKITSICLLLTCFILPLLTACSKESNEDNNNDSYGNENSSGKGRYIESELVLSDKNSEESVVAQLLKQDGSIMIYTAGNTKQDTISLFQYRYDNKPECEKEVPQWLQNIPISNFPYKMQIIEGTDGVQYLFLLDSKEGGYLYKTTDGKTRTELNMKGWRATNNQPEVFPITVGILENGLLVASTMKGCYLYEIPSGKIKELISGDYFAEALTVSGNKFVVVNENNGEGTIKAISIYDADNLESTPEEINIDGPTPLQSTVSLNKAGDLIIANAKGIHVLIKGTGTWQTVMDGSLNRMYVPNTICDNIIQDNKENYYIIYKDYYSREGSIKKYQFDKTVNTLPSQELTIYTLEDNELLRGAVSAFQKTHTDYKVSIKVAMTADSVLTKEDYIRSLNTELLNGAGCDLILLDGLPIEAYIEKGVLADISGIINPYIKNNKLFSSVVNSNYIGDKIYAIPSRVKLPGMFGKTEAVHACDTLDHMAEYTKTHMDKSLLGEFTYEDYLQEFLPCYMHNIKTADGKISFEGIKRFLEDTKLILDNTGCLPEYQEGSGETFSDSLPVKTILYKNTITNLRETGTDLSMMHFVNGDFIPFENSYMPANIIGINKASKQQEAAKEFVECILSDEVQMMDAEWMGLPININAFKNMKVKRVPWMGSEYPITYEDGTQGVVPLADISDTDKKKLIDYCMKVTERAYTDDNILNAIKELGKNYVLGEETIDKTVDLIMNKLSIYNEE